MGFPTLLLSEFGATDNPDILNALTGLADQNMVGWQEWHYCGCADPTTSGAGDKQVEAFARQVMPEFT